MTNSCHWSAKAVRISCWAADSAGPAKRVVLARASTVSSRSRRPGLSISARRTAPKGDRDVASAASSSTATRRARRGTGSNTKSSVLAWICGQCHLQAGVHRQRLAALQRAALQRAALQRAALQRIAHLDWTCFSATGRRRRRKDAERNGYNPLTHN
jgi:hypothetical protein